MGWAAKLAGDAKRTERLIYLRRVCATLSDAQVHQIHPHLAALIRPKIEPETSTHE